MNEDGVYYILLYHGVHASTLPLGLRNSSGKHRSATDFEADMAALRATRPEDPLTRFMNWDEVRRMDQSPLIDFGAHTVDHVSLGRVPLDEAKRQIDRSINDIRRELGACDLFSYPEEQGDDFGPEVIAHLRPSASTIRRRRWPESTIWAGPIRSTFTESW